MEEDSDVEPDEDRQAAATVAAQAAAAGTSAQPVSTTTCRVFHCFLHPTSLDCRHTES